MAVSARFDLTPEKAVAFFKGKGLSASFAWQDMLHEEHDRAFTVAKMMYLDLLTEVRTHVDRAISEGLTLRDFRSDLEPILVKAGWWGKAEMADPATGETKLVQLGSPRRLRTIYDTNLRTAYAAGHWERIQDNAERAPYVMYSAVLDGRTRPQHQAWHGTVLRSDDPWWKTHTPPNGWNCRCTVIQLSERDLEKLGKSGPDSAPPSPTREWTNPRTGEVLDVPVGVDPGWGYAPGASTRRAETLEMARVKLEGAPPDLAAATIRDLVGSDVFRTFYDRPAGEFPVGLLAEADAQRIGAETRVVRFSAETAAKQKNQHPELDAQEYAWVQETIERGEVIADAALSLIYLLVDGGYVSVVKATETGKAVFLASFRRLSSDAGKRDREISRLLGRKG